MGGLDGISAWPGGRRSAGWLARDGRTARAGDLDGPYKLRFSWALENPDKRIAGLEKLLRRLGAEDQAAAAA